MNNIIFMSKISNNSRAILLLQEKIAKMKIKVHRTDSNPFFLAFVAAFYFCAIFAEAKFGVDSDFGKKISSRQKQELEVSSDSGEELPRNGRNLPQRQRNLLRKVGKILCLYGKEVNFPFALFQNDGALSGRSIDPPSPKQSQFSLHLNIIMTT